MRTARTAPVETGTMPSIPIRILLSLAAALIAVASGCSRAPAPEAAVAVAQPRLIPAPAQMRVQGGALQLPAAAEVAATGGAGAEQAAARLSELSQRLHAHGLQRADSASASVHFELDAAAGLAREAYRIEVTDTQARAIASDAAGLFHAATSLALLMQVGEGGASIPKVSIEDVPRFGWRGLMLDSARHAQSVDEIKHLLDSMALHKLNVLHWHLTDDQGWRIEIKQFPRLTEVGGCRIPAGAAGRDPLSGEPSPYCAWYSQAQIRELVAYASARHIEIVPEIDLPGHAQAAIAAYPQLGLLDPALPVSPDWGVHSILFSVEEDTVRTLEQVLDEVVALFPGRFIHIGGDEAVKDQWRASARVQARMRELGVDSEEALQSWLIQRMERYLAAKGRRLIGWDEILEGGLPAGAAVMSWRGIEGGVVAAGQGHDVVMSPSSELYFDYLQSGSEREVPGRPAMIPISRVYAFEPVPPALAADKHGHVLGLQANVWTEHLRSYARVQHAVFPRIAALAERGWSSREQRDFNDFVLRLAALLPAYRALDIAYADTGFEVQLRADLKPGLAQATVRLSVDAGDVPIHYSLDGTPPGPESPRYSTALDLPLPAEVLAAVVINGEAQLPLTKMTLTADSLRLRRSPALMPATPKLVLRLEDDQPLDSASGDARAIFNVDIFEPRWEWPASPVGAGDRLRVRAGRIPYNFQLHGDEANRRFVPAVSPHGELRLQRGCDGPVLAEQVLPADTPAAGFAEFELQLQSGTAPTDLCLQFSGDSRPQLWVIDHIELLPATGRP
jgi:hexosaminidase